jgi:hypothetical protein
MIELTPTILLPYFTGQAKHSAYAETVNRYNALKVHANGEYPAALIDDRRPNEPEEVKKYRKSIYEPITQDVILRVMASLSKIRRSSDWNVQYNLGNYPSRIAEEERLDWYTEKNYPITGAYENWLFTIALKNYLLDANAVVLIAPIMAETADNEYLRPFATVYNSPRVIEFIPDELLIVSLEPDTSVGQKKAQAQRFLAVNKQSMQRYIQKDDGYVMEWEYVHNLGVLPAFKIGGQYFSSVGRNLLYDSRIAPMVPRLNDAAREYSDLQAEVVLHIHSETWSWASTKCPRCQDGSGIPRGFVNDDKTKKRLVCPTCNGNQLISSSPYSTLTVRPSNENMGEQAAPIPPKGYITKPIDIVKIQDERVDKHLFRALAAINMQFLDQTPLNISGVGKEVDRDELNNFVYSVAEDLVRIADNSYSLFADYRYALLVPERNDRAALIPEIKVPEKYDLLSSNYLTEEIKSVRDAQISSVVAAALEVEFASKKFYTNPIIRETVKAVLLLDPLAGVDEDDKSLRFSTGGVTRLDYVMSSNINQLVQDAVYNDPDFITLGRLEQLKIIRALAEQKVKEIDKLKVRIEPLPE